MQESINLQSLSMYSRNGVGPIIIALAFVIALGGMAAAAITVCGWRDVRSMSMNWAQKRLEVVCR